MSDVETPEEQAPLPPTMHQDPRSIVRKSSLEMMSSNGSYNGRPSSSRSVKESSRSAAPPPTVDPRTASRRFAVIMVGILIIICLGIVAIVLPFFIDSNNCNCNKSSESDGTPTTPSAPVVSPTSAPATTPTVEQTTERFNQFVDNYARDISGDGPFEDPNSPQYRAAKFIADDSDFAEDISDLNQLNDLYAVTVFYYATNGDNWRTCSQGSSSCGGESWLNAQVGHCDWNFLTCDNAGRVIGIIFSANGNNLDGTLPLELGLLQEMQRFIVDNNRISGSFPTEFSQLTNMQRLIVSSNAMSGTIADDFLINSGSTLQILRLDGNDFSGEIPSAALDEYSVATALTFEDNSFTGSISATTCARVGNGLQELTVDCNEVSCDCCTNC